MPASIPIGGLGLTFLSCCLTATVIGNAYYQKKQFYPSVVYITKSNPSMAAIYLMAFTMVILFGKLLKKIFFGTLRAAESEHLIERFFYAVTETCLAFTVFRDDFSPKFVALFTVLLFLKAFHWLSDYRVDYMEQSPVITRLFHVRIASLLILLSTIDLLLVRHAYHSTMSLGASVQLVFGFEYAILLTVAYNIGIKYICHAIDLHSENPWENKAMYLLYTELFVGFIKVLLYIAFLLIMVRIHTFPLFIIRPMYLTMKSFKRALQDMLQSRRAIHNMNTLYPNASAEDLQHADNVCIICREEMALNTGVKKLPCNHLFHALCLRSWFQRQQTCPTCRLDVLRPTPAQQQAQQQPPPLQQQQQQHQQQHQQQQQLPPQGRRPPTNIMEFLQQLMDQEERGQRNNAGPQVGDRPPAAAVAAPPAGPFGGFMPPFPPFPILPPQLLHQIQQLQQQQQLHHEQQQQQHQQQQAAASSGPAGSESSTTTTTTATTAANTAATTSTPAATITGTAAPTITPTTATASTAAAHSASPTLPPFPMMPPPFFGAIPGPGPFPLPPFPPMGLGGSFPPPPVPPANYSCLTTAELRAMEGRAREHVIARLQALDNVSTLVRAACIQLTQYDQLMSRLDAEFPLPTTTPSVDTAISSATTSSTTTTTTSLAETSATATSSSSTSATSTVAPPVASSSVTSNGSVPTAAASSSSEAASGSGVEVIDPNSAEEVRRRRLQRFAADTDVVEH